MRKQGYYWVKVESEFGDKWVLSEYGPSTGFWFIGKDWFIHECDTDEIDERRIVRGE